jgi:hypothetical protein
MRITISTLTQEELDKLTDVMASAVHKLFTVERDMFAKRYVLVVHDPEGDPDKPFLAKPQGWGMFSDIPIVKVALNENGKSGGYMLSPLFSSRRGQADVMKHLAIGWERGLILAGIDPVGMM